jgi:hypothetical protein
MLPVPSVFNQGDRIPVTGNCYAQSGYVYGVSWNMLDKLEDDKYAYWQKINPYYPFHDEGKWELGKFLVENLTQTQITKFLKLRWVNDEYQPSFNPNSDLAFIVWHSRSRKTIFCYKILPPGLDGLVAFFYPMESL